MPGESGGGLARELLGGAVAALSEVSPNLFEEDVGVRGVGGPAQLPPSSVVTWIRPSSVPAHRSPRSSGDSASAVTVPLVSASEPTASVFPGSLSDRSSEIANQ